MEKFCSGMEKSRILDPGSGINIPDPQNWYFCYFWVPILHPVHYLGPRESSSARWGPPTMPFWTSRSCAKWTSIREATHLHKQLPRTALFTAVHFLHLCRLLVYKVTVNPRGYKEMSSILADQFWRLRKWAQMRGKGGSCGVSANE